MNLKMGGVGAGQRGSTLGPTSGRQIGQRPSFDAGGGYFGMKHLISDRQTQDDDQVAVCST